MSRISTRNEPLTNTWRLDHVRGGPVWAYDAGGPVGIRQVVADPSGNREQRRLAQRRAARAGKRRAA